MKLKDGVKILYEETYKGSPLTLQRGDGGLAKFDYTSKNNSTPSYIWGYYSDNTYKLYNPAKFSVNYATSANKDGSGNIISSTYVTLATVQSITATKTFTANIVMSTNSYIYGGSAISGGAMLHFDGTRTVLGSIGSTSTAATHIRSITGHATIGTSTTATYNIWDDGNAITTNHTNALINTLTTGGAVPVDADYYISQYVGGGTTTTTYHRRPISTLWSYISSKITNNLYWANVKVSSSLNTTTAPTFGSTTVSNLFVNTGDSTLKIYSGKITDAKSDGHVGLQTCINGEDGQTSSYTSTYQARNVLALQPRGGEVYIGTMPDGGNTNYKLYVNGSTYVSSNINGITSLQTETLDASGSRTSTTTKASILRLWGPTYGNTKTDIISGSTYLSYGDGGPQIQFSQNTTDNSTTQSGALIFTDNDNIAPGVSLSFVTNQSTGYFIAPHFKTPTGKSTQFLKADGSFDSNAYLTTSSASSTYVTIANAQTISGTKTFSSQIVSSVAQGTSPFSITSTTINSNLNADLLDGYHASGLFTALANTSDSPAKLSITIGGTNKTLTVGHATHATVADYPTNFTSYTPSYGWGKLSTSTTTDGTTIYDYTRVTSWGVNGGSFAFATKDGQLFAQIDGKFYQNEGRYVVLDSNSVGSGVLTGYSIASSDSNISATDTLNTALGKLQKKLNTAYDLVKTASDSDGAIENLQEVLNVLSGISDTDTIKSLIGKYLPLAGGTMNNTAFIKFADSNNYAKSDVTFPYTTGGLQWNEQFDWIKLYAQATASDNINLVLHFGDDSTPGFAVKNYQGIQTAFLSSAGALTLAQGITLTTNAGSTPLNITRSGSKTECVAMSVSDTVYNIIYTNDEAASSVNLTLINTDTENSDKSNTSSYTYKFQHNGTFTAKTLVGNLTNTLTFASGAFSAKTYNNSGAVTVNIPINVSQLTNDSGYITTASSKFNNYVLKSGDTMTGALILPDKDVNATSYDGSLIIGSSTSVNMGIDANKIQARKYKSSALVASTLYLNIGGGAINIGGSISPNTPHSLNLGSIDYPFNKTYTRYISTHSGYDLRICTADTERLHIASTTGNVGIGITEPDYRLDVLGSIRQMSNSVSANYTNSSGSTALSGSTNLIISQTADSTSGSVTSPSFSDLDTYSQFTTTAKYFRFNKTIKGTITNSDTVDSWHGVGTSGLILNKSGYVVSNTSNLSSYWCKLASFTWGDQYDDRDITLYIHGAYMSHAGILHIRARWSSSSNFNISGNLIAGNLPVDRFKLYYDNSTVRGTIELWANAYQQYGVYNCKVLSETSRVGAEAGIITLYRTSFTTVQTPTLTNSVNITNYTINNSISGTAAVATKLGTIDIGSNTQFIYLDDGTPKVSSWQINTTNTPFGKIPSITPAGVMEIGRYLDFHHDNTTASDYSTRLQTRGNNSNIVNLPSTSGTLALTSQIPDVTNYYWADIPISDTKSTATIPTFAQVKIGNSAAGPNYISFYGLTSDGASSFSHTYIGERLYNSSDYSELVLFKGNDRGGADVTVASDVGPDRIRHIAGGHLFQTFTGSLSGDFETVCSSTTLVNLFAVNKTNITSYVEFNLYKSATISYTNTSTSTTSNIIPLITSKQWISITTTQSGTSKPYVYHYFDIIDANSVTTPQFVFSKTVNINANTYINSTLQVATNSTGSAVYTNTSSNTTTTVTGSYKYTQLLHLVKATSGTSTSPTASDMTYYAQFNTSATYFYFNKKILADVDTLDGRHMYQLVRNYGSEVNLNPLAYQGNYFGMSTTSGITTDYWHIISMNWGSSEITGQTSKNKWLSQLALPTEQRKGVYYRNQGNDWIKLLDESNEYKSNVTTLTSNITPETEWNDTGISSSNLTASGTYIIQMFVNDTSDLQYNMYYSGIMSWYYNGVNDTDSDEIQLHAAGHNYGKRLYLRTKIHSASDSDETVKAKITLQIAADVNFSGTETITFKFKRII